MIHNVPFVDLCGHASHVLRGDTTLFLDFSTFQLNVFESEDFAPDFDFEQEEFELFLGSV